MRPEPGDWVFRATYPVPELGLLRGDWLRVDDNDLHVLVGRRRYDVDPFLPHLVQFRVEDAGPGLTALLRRARPDDGRPPLRGAPGRRHPLLTLVES